MMAWTWGREPSASRTTKVMGGDRPRTEGLKGDGDFAADMASPSLAPAEDVGIVDSGPADEGLFALEQVLVAQTELSRPPVTLSGTLSTSSRPWNQ